MTALAARARTAAAGATATNELVNIVDFYRAQIAPDLQSTDANQVCVEAQLLVAPRSFWDCDPVTRPVPQCLTLPRFPSQSLMANLQQPCVQSCSEPAGRPFASRMPTKLAVPAHHDLTSCFSPAVAGAEGGRPQVPDHLPGPGERL